MAQDLRRICILSGPSEAVDLSRAGKGLDYRMSLENPIPFRILGAGPDLFAAMCISDLYSDGNISKEEYVKKMGSLNQHFAMYRFLLDATGETPETVTRSLTLVQNVLHGFREEQGGRYAVVTEPWHYKKFNMVQDSLKRKGKISEDLEFFNVPSPDTGYYSLIQKIAPHVKTQIGLLRI